MCYTLQKLLCNSRFKFQRTNYIIYFTWVEIVLHNVNNAYCFKLKLSESVTKIKTGLILNYLLENEAV